MVPKKRLAALFILLSFVLAACSGVTGKPSKVKIAVSVPEAIGFGKTMKNTIELALEEAGGEVNGIEIEPVYLNSSDPDGNPLSPEQEAEIAAEAVADEDVILYIGPVSSDQAKASLPILNEANIAQINPACTWPGLSKPGFGPGEPGIYYPTGQRNLFRMVPSDDVQGVVAADWAKQLGYSKIAIVDDSSAFGAGVAGIFGVRAQDVGLEIVAHEQFDPYNEDVSMSDLETISQNLLDDQPDLIYYGGAAFPRGIELITALHTLDPNIPVLGADGLVQDQVPEELGDLADNLLATTVAVPPSALDNPAAAEFVSAFESKFGQAPGAYIANVYESAKLALYVLEKTETYTRAGVLETLTNIEEYTGVLGTWHFSPEGDISIDTIGGMQIQNGAWEFVEVIE